VSTRLQLSSNSLLNWFLLPKSNCLNSEPHFVHEMIASQIGESFKSLICDDSALSRFTVEIPKIELASYDSQFIGPVADIKSIAARDCTDLVKGIIVHGSVASRDFIVGWSDLDATIIISESTLEDPKKLCRLREASLSIHECIQRFDRLQHHGIHFLSPYDLLAYPDTYLPHVLYQDAVSLLGNLKLDISVRNSMPEQVERFNSIHRLFKESIAVGEMRHHQFNGEYLQDSFVNADNAMYQMKYFLSLVMLLPSYFANLRGILCSKSRSFELCRPFISEKAWSIVELASQVRSEWAIHSPPVKNEIPDWIQQIIGENYFERGYNFTCELQRNLIDAGIINSSGLPTGDR